MPEPTIPTRQEQDWESKGPVVNDKTVTKGATLGMGGKPYRQISFANGETWEQPVDGSEPPQLIATDTPTANRWRLIEAARVKSEADAEKLRQKAESIPYNPDEMEWSTEENREILSRRGLPSEKNDKWTDPTDGSVWIIDIQGNKIRQLSGPIPGYVPGRGVPAPSTRAPQTQAEMEADRLKVRGLEQGLGAGMPFAMEQYDKIVDVISSRMARGEIDEREGDRLLNQSMTLLDAAARGMMPEDYEKNRQGVAQDIFTKRAGIAPGLVQGFSGMFDKQLPPSDPKEMENILRNGNPMAMARSFVEELYGGKQLTPLAQAVLRGSMGGRPPTIEEKGYPPIPPVAGGQ